MTTRACQLLIACALTVAVLASQEVLSDQTAAELPDLFEQLQSSPSPELARNFEQEIWRLWLEGPTDDAGNSLARARIAMSMGDLDQAEASLTALIKLAPTFAEARNQRALLWFLRENYPAALSDIDETLAG